jgi:fructoselysine-6-P-deglycase FrlB-like protein
VTHTTTVALPPPQVLRRAKQFFTERVPNAAAFLEQEGPEFVVLRGQGGEEIVLHAWVDANGKTLVRASTLFFDQALDRFFSTLPLETDVQVA